MAAVLRAATRAVLKPPPDCSSGQIAGAMHLA